MSTMNLRDARPEDVPVLVDMIHALAAHFGSADRCKVAADVLSTQLFAPNPLLFALVAERDGEIVGLATWYVTYSTWDAAHGVHVEDLYIADSYRRLGIGVTMLSHMAAMCVRRGYTRLEAQAADWNTPPELLTGRGAARLDAWSSYRLSGEALVVFAGRQPGGDGPVGLDRVVG